MSEADIKILEEFIKDYESVTDPLEKSSYYEEVPIKSIKNLVERVKELEERFGKLEYKQKINEWLWRIKREYYEGIESSSTSMRKNIPLKEYEEKIKQAEKEKKIKERRERMRKYNTEYQRKRRARMKEEEYEKYHEKIIEHQREYRRKKRKGTDKQC